MKSSKTWKQSVKWSTLTVFKWKIHFIQNQGLLKNEVLQSSQHEVEASPFLLSRDLYCHLLLQHYKERKITLITLVKFRVWQVLQFRAATYSHTDWPLPNSRVSFTWTWMWLEPSWSHAILFLTREYIFTLNFLTRKKQPYSPLHGVSPWGRGRQWQLRSNREIEVWKHAKEWDNTIDSTENLQ